MHYINEFVLPRYLSELVKTRCNKEYIAKRETSVCNDTNKLTPFLITETQLEQFYISVPFTCIHCKQNFRLHIETYRNNSNTLTEI